MSTVVLSEEMAGPRTGPSAASLWPSPLQISHVALDRRAEHKLPLDDDGSYEDAIRLCILSSPRKALTFDQVSGCWSRDPVV